MHTLKICGRFRDLCFGHHLAIAALAALCLVASSPARAGLVDFEIVQSLSHMKLSQTFDFTLLGGGIATTVPQYPDPDGAGPITGSDTTSFFGNILGDWDSVGNTIALKSGGQWTLAVNNTPGKGGVPGAFSPFDPISTDPVGYPGGTTPNANYGITLAAPLPVIEVYYGMRGDWYTDYDVPRPMAPNGTFQYSFTDLLGNAAGRRAYVSLVGNETTSLVGPIRWYSPDDPVIAKLGSNGTMLPSWNPLDITAGPLGTLTIPIESTFEVPITIPGAGAATVSLVTTGQIVATPKVPEPSSCLLAVSGFIGLIALAWRRHKR